MLAVNWYDRTKWLLEWIDTFAENQRFVFGPRLADHALDVREVLVEAPYSPRKAELLARANSRMSRASWWLSPSQGP